MIFEQPSGAPLKVAVENDRYLFLRQNSARHGLLRFLHPFRQQLHRP